MTRLRLTRRGKVVGAATLLALAAGLGAWTGSMTMGVDYRQPMPACTSDDGSGPRPCAWDASTQGNGRGHSFWVDKDDNTHYDQPGE